MEWFYSAGGQHGKKSGLKENQNALAMVFGHFWSVSLDVVIDQSERC